MIEPKRYYIVSAEGVQIHHTLIVQGIQINPSTIAHNADWPEDKRIIVKKPGWYGTRGEAEAYIKKFYEKSIRKFRELMKDRRTYNVRKDIALAINNLDEKMNAPVQWGEFSFDTAEEYDAFIADLKRKNQERLNKN